MKITLRIVIVMLLLATLLIAIGIKVMRANQFVDPPAITKTTQNALPLSNQSEVNAKRNDTISSTVSAKVDEKNDAQKSK
jgi:hypothetical protein